jgi:hypothetical protein
MITYDDIVGPWEAHPDLTPLRAANIRQRLLPACWALERLMRADGIEFPLNPVTGASVSGETLGGFRPQDARQGAPRSNHKEGLAVDRYDPDSEIDAWCLSHPAALVTCGIWIEHPESTPGWAHWQCVPPKSGRRVFRP